MVLQHRVRTILLSALIAAAGSVAAGQQASVPPAPPGLAVQSSADAINARTLADAQLLFYNARYEEAAVLALTLRTAEPEDLTAYELRSSALLFQVRRAIGDPPDKDRAFKQCVPCPGLMSAFQTNTTDALKVARARLAKDPADHQAMFFLGKLNLNYVWLQLGTLGRRTGWSEYWEARHSLDAVLKRNPQDVRARVARAWIDYIVDTRAPFGFKWILGGGNKKKGLATVRAAAGAEAERFVRAEAGFALWDMQVREKNFTEAVVTARALARDFPDNRELADFLVAHPSR